MEEQKRKSLKDISWQVDEPTYRADSALSYSTLAKYEKNGFSIIPKLFDKIESPSLTFGSAVDSIITGGMNEFNERFLVAEFPSLGDKEVKLVIALFDAYNANYHTIEEIPDEEVIAFTETQEYQKNWKPETRAKVIKERGAQYYNLLYLSMGKTIIDTQTWGDIKASVTALQNNPATKFYFQNDDPWDDSIQRFYQLKFKGTLNNIPYRIMADLIIVDHKLKKIIPVDLKTSSHYEYDFYKSFNDWNYDIQARLYWAIIRQNMDNDEYFKDFFLEDYRFIVVNKRTLTPLIWVYNYTKDIERELYLGKNKEIRYRSPLVIGEELYKYLNNPVSVPEGIDVNGPNNIVEWLNKEN